MGISIISYYSYYFTKKYEKVINQKEDWTKTSKSKSLKSLELKNVVELGKNDIICEIK